MSNETPDWSTIPAPENDGAADHLEGTLLPDLPLPSTGGAHVSFATMPGLSVVYCYPMTGRPDRAAPDGWDQIPGARGCTPQSCAYRDRLDELRSLGADQVYGLSTQEPGEQAEAAERLGLPFSLVSDHHLELAEQLLLPTFEADGQTRLKRLTMIVEDGEVKKVFYPVFPPDADAGHVADWLRARS
ncbi:peroxiredoxin [Palleronia sp. LCG004]|uniref:peroxiredoxin n=1 Tax=Palleronia sp. LCG004 TaxID=3079304 RepID=UPI002943B4C0|nr:peroxiredoxin [Palleronia sp. LCG004]WOI57396.1 peroxiredoxin [Palleronia sp. LCG004]